MKKFFRYFIVAGAVLLLTAAGVWKFSGGKKENTGKSSALPRIFYSGAGGTVKSLDPAYADDLASRDLTALCYDTLVQYDYLARPYRLVPSMASAMPEVSADKKSYTFTLRDDLFFADDGTFERGCDRKVTAQDVKFSILRIADARNHSPVYWIYRNRIAGLLIALPALAACVPHAQIVAPGILQNPVLLWSLAILNPVLSYFYLDYYTARAGAGAIIILAYDLIHYAYEEQLPGAAVLTVAAWLFGFAAIWVSGKPHALRDWFRLAARNRKFGISAAAASLLCGACFAAALIGGLQK